MIYLDTHVVALLYAGNADSLSRRVRQSLAGGDVRISPMVAVELQLPYEIGRAKAGAAAVLIALNTEMGIRLCDLPFQEVVQAAFEET